MPIGNLDATLTYRATKTDDGLARYVGTVELANSQSAEVGSWNVTLTVPGGNAVTADGPVAESQHGEAVSFTPAGDDGVVPGGGSLTFTFTVRGILSELPAGCAINGRACS
jgi:uncharacterized protein YndB with AHSA1/START domain